MRHRSRLLPAAVLAIALLSAGCATDQSVKRRSGGETRYIAGTGVLDRIPADSRAAPVDFGGELLDGGTWSLDQQRGKVVVLNVWGSWCPPCREEAPDLQRASEQLADRGVVFIGVNTKDTRAGARAYVREFGVTYPSVYDESGEALLAFRDTLPPAAIPTTVVIDPAGRVAARVLGQIDRSTVVGVVEDILAESSPNAGLDG